MRFTKLELTNWRNFRAAAIPFQPRTFVVGPNASGKSNLLDALRFLKELAEDGGGLQRAAKQRGGLKAMRSLHARSQTNVGLSVRIGDDDGTAWGYDLVLGETAERRPIVVREEVVQFNHADGVHHRDPVASGEDEEDQTETWLEQRSQSRRFRELIQFFASIEYSHVVPQVVREQRRPVEPGRGRDPYGADLIDEMATTLAPEQQRRLAVINDALAAVLPQLVDVAVTRDAVGRPHLVGTYKHWRASGARQHEDQFSDGTLRLIGLLWALSGPGGPILLEEPEISLHERAVALLPTILHRVASTSGRQIIVSTHSQALLDDTGIEPREIIRLETTAEDTEIRMGSDDPLLVELASNGQSFGAELVGMTAPRDLDALARFGG